MKTKPTSHAFTPATLDRLKTAGIDTQSPVALAMHALKFGHLDPAMVREIAAAIRAIPRDPDLFLMGLREAIKSALR